MNSILYKLVVNGYIVAEGSKGAIKKLSRQRVGSFVGIGSPLPSVGKRWGSVAEVAS